MAEKVKAKKAKTQSKKASPKTRKSDGVIKQEEEVLEPVIKRNKTGKILTRSNQKEVPEVRDNATLDDEQDDSGEMPPLEQKFTSSELIVPNVSPKIIDTGKPRSNPENGEQLHVKLSKSLIRKLREQAADEGIALDEFVTELLSESVVLRAWEIVERKNQMKGGSHPMGNNRSNGPQQQNRNNNQQQGQRSTKGHRGMNHSRYQNIMEDKGAFMEYVRGQERTRR
jgi:hypothetical protein